MIIQKTETNWRETLASGDIVNFLYPSTEDDAAVEKHRPCLILEVDREKAEVIVVYGTAARTRANVGHEIRITKSEDLDAACLRKPTRFVGARHIRVPLTSERFIKSQDGCVRIGQLPPSLHDRLNRIRDLLRTPERRVRSLYCRTRGRRGHTATQCASLCTEGAI